MTEVRTELQKTSNDVLLTAVQRQEVAAARVELTEAVDGMVVAIRNNKSLQINADKLKSKGFVSAIWGAISGSNDRDLATMVKELGGSLETTQKAVQVVLRLQTRKDHVLREFHSVLIDKIQKIQADTHTLDANQQSAVDVLCEFQEQIEDQLRHHEAVERHELKIAELIQIEVELQRGLQALDGQIASLKNASDHLATEVDRVKKDLAALQIAGHDMLELIEGLKKQFTAATDTHAKRLEHLSEVATDLARRTELIEMQFTKQASLLGWLNKNAVALISLAIAGIAFAHSLL